MPNAPAGIENAESDLRTLVPHISEYFGWWAINDQAFRGMFEHFKSLNVFAHIEQTRAAAQSTDAPKPLAADYRRIGGGGQTGKQIAFVEITGPMMKFRTSMGGGCSTLQVRRQVRAAANDPSIGAILMHYDTPGGTYAGTADLGEDIKKAAAVKPVTSFVSDACCSAGFWSAAQGTEVVATKTSMLGSIGTFLRVEDTSGAAAAAGVKVHVLRAGAFKGRGVDGVEVDAEALEEMQRLVNSLNEFFILAVADGRRLKLETVRELADGRVHLASEAQKLGLIDRVSSLDDELARINQRLTTGKVRTMTEINPQSTAQTPQGGSTNADVAAQAVPTPEAAAVPAAAPAAALAAAVTELQPRSATLAEIEAACPGADPAFVLSQLKQGATVATATTAFITAQNERINQLQTAQPQTPPKRDLAGVDPLQTTGKVTAGGSPPLDQMNAYIAEKRAQGIPADKAMRMFNKENPELRAMVVAAANS